MKIEDKAYFEMQPNLQGMKKVRDEIYALAQTHLRLSEKSTDSMKKYSESATAQALSSFVNRAPYAAEIGMEFKGSAYWNKKAMQLATEGAAYGVIADKLIAEALSIYNSHSKPVEDKAYFAVSPAETEKKIRDLTAAWRKLMNVADNLHGMANPSPEIMKRQDQVDADMERIGNQIAELKKSIGVQENVSVRLAKPVEDKAYFEMQPNLQGMKKVRDEINAIAKMHYDLSNYPFRGSLKYNGLTLAYALGSFVSRAPYAAEIGMASKGATYWNKKAQELEKQGLASGVIADKLIAEALSIYNSHSKPVEDKRYFDRQGIKARFDKEWTEAGFSASFFIKKLQGMMAVYQGENDNEYRNKIIGYAKTLANHPDFVLNGVSSQALAKKAFALVKFKYARTGTKSKFANRGAFAEASSSPVLGSLLEKKVMPEGGWRAVETDGAALVIAFEDGDIAGNFARRASENGYSATAPMAMAGRFWNVKVQNENKQ